jgi:hypothetical protein
MGPRIRSSRAILSNEVTAEFRTSRINFARRPLLRIVHTHEGDDVVENNERAVLPSLTLKIVRTPVFVAAASVLFIAAGVFAEANYEVPPDEPPASFLPAALVAGENFKIVDPVSSDGLMRRYVIESSFGRFEAYGRSQLEIRVYEVAALTVMAKTSDVKLVANGVAQGVETQVKTVTGVVTHPVKTVTGIPRG